MFQIHGLATSNDLDATGLVQAKRHWSAHNTKPRWSRSIASADVWFTFDVYNAGVVMITSNRSEELTFFDTFALGAQEAVPGAP